MCRVVITDLAPLVSSAGLARRWVAEYLQRWELVEESDVATLLVSELVANAVVHGVGRPRLILAVADGTIEVGVTDGEPRLPRAAWPCVPTDAQEIDAALWAEGGRGMLLVERLADEWGAAGLADGKQVWFRLDVQYWSYRSACRCHRDDLDRVRLESGRYALASSGPWDVQPA